MCVPATFMVRVYVQYGYSTQGSPDWMGSEEEPLVGFAWRGGWRIASRPAGCRAVPCGPDGVEFATWAGLRTDIRER
jgi:hypothetical protein